MPSMTFEQRLWAGTSKGLAEECWEWQGAKGRGRYGTISWNGKRIRTHRASWMLAHGDIPDGLEVCHHCDNPPCVNPAHLFVGTHSENMKDARRKGRQPLPHEIGSIPHNALKSHCIRGHAFSVGNTLINRHGGRCCRECQKMHRANYNAKRQRALNPEHTS